MGTTLALFILAPMLDLRHLVEGLGPAAFLAFFFLVTVVGLPNGPLIVAAGLLYGPGLGLLLVTAGCVLGAGASYWIARWFAGPQSQQWLEEQPWWERVKPLLAAHGGPVVALVRNLPGLPYSVQNYALALAGVPFGTYVVWTTVGIFPFCLLTIVGTELVLRPTLWLGALFAGMSVTLVGGLVWARRRVFGGGPSK